MALNKEYQTYLQALLHLRDNGPSDEQFGICFNGDDIIASGVFDYYNFYDFVSQWSIDWPKHSGCKPYPIPQSTKEKYTGHWSGEQGQLRYELIDYLIAKLVDMDRKHEIQKSC